MENLSVDTEKSKECLIINDVSKKSEELKIEIKNVENVEIRNKNGINSIVFEFKDGICYEIDLTTELTFSYLLKLIKNLPLHNMFIKKKCGLTTNFDENLMSINNNGSYIIFVPLKYNCLLQKNLLNLVDLRSFKFKTLRSWIKFRQLFKLYISPLDKKMYYNFMFVFKQNKKIFNVNLLYLSAKYNFYELYCFLENSELKPCYVISCLCALKGKSLNILKHLHERYKYTSQIWIKQIKGLKMINGKYIIDKNYNYENTDWSVIYYGIISNQSDELNVKLKDFLICIGCPLNENLSFNQ